MAHQADGDRQRAWFTRRVTTAALRAELTVDLAVVWVHSHDDRTGAFEASLEVRGGSHDGGGLARRPRSAGPWPLRWSTVDHRWSTSRWDWALTLHGPTLSADGLAAIQYQLGDAP